MDRQKRLRLAIAKVFSWVSQTGPGARLTGAALVLAAFDTFVRPLSVIALGLLTLAALPWLLQIVKSKDWPLKSMKLPGGVQFDFKELEKIGEEAEVAGLLKRAEHKYSFEAIFDRDPSLAMAGLRIEMERRLREIAEMSGLDTERLSLWRLVRKLEGQGSLDQRAVSVISDLLPALNRAAHAQDLGNFAFDWAIDVGPQILAGLDAKIQEIKDTSN